MSRSLGDAIAKKLGVTAEPSIFEVPLNGKSENFAIIASDGVWDVMSNEEVVTYIENFRTNAVQDTQASLQVPKVTTESSSISQLV
jgi:serine/threonine protein phosphatase PrpC